MYYTNLDGSAPSKTAVYAQAAFGWGIIAAAFVLGHTIGKKKS